MCLGIPGEILSIEEGPMGLRGGKVSFGGTVRQVNLSYTPQAGPGDFVIVHVGFAISQVDAKEARKVFDYLQEMGELEELGPEAAPSAQGRRS
ncbi:MAG TPA: HypC/HybG/HupF family hydrogenase formation chaperone [Acidobacteriota bacterium]|nr:HypC/HybG/HupF family hydrogenase formation chaperone [Acidobacteriota bacterium]